VNVTCRRIICCVEYLRLEKTYITAEIYTTAKVVLDNTPVARPDDPDSRVMAAHTTVGGGDYAQVAVDAKHKTIVEQAV
jgi:hypothetical protein